MSSSVSLKDPLRISRHNARVDTSHFDCRAKIPEDETEVWLTDQFKTILSDTDYVCFYAYRGKNETNPLGYVTAGNNDNYFYIGHLAVDKHCRDDGIGDMLLAHVLKYFDRLSEKIKKDGVLLNAAPYARNYYKKPKYGFVYHPEGKEAEPGEDQPMMITIEYLKDWVATREASDAASAKTSASVI